MIAWLVLQAAVAGPFLPLPKPPPSAGDRPCPIGQPGEDIVVCARRNDDAFRLKPLPDRYVANSGLPRAEIPLLGNAKAVAEVEGATVGGVPSNRIMLRLKLPF